MAARGEQEQRLDVEIATLRQRLEDAEEMRRAITHGEIDGFVMSPRADDPRIVLLETAQPGHVQILDRMQQGATTISQTGEILYANRRFAAMVDQPLARLFSASLLDYVDARDRARVDAFLAAAALDSTIEALFASAAGKMFKAQLALVSCGDGYMSLLISDLTSLERLNEAEEALQAIRQGDVDGIVVGERHVLLLEAAQRPYERMMDRMQQGAVALASGGEVLYASERFAAMIGIDRQRLLGERLERFVTLDSRALLQEVLLGTIPSTGECELSLKRADGSLLPVGVATVSRDEDATTLVLSDLTEQKRHQALEEADRRKDEFLATVAHELRNPLAPIRNAVELLDRTHELPPPARYAAQVIGRQATTLTRLVDDLLDIHRLTQGKLTLRRQPLDLRTVIEAAVEAAEPGVREKRHTLDIVLPPEPVYANGDAVRLTQVVLNLVSNAVKYTADQGRVRVSLEQLGGELPSARICVQDSGYGIPSPLLKKIFDPYVQLQYPGKDVGSGLGLGLSVSRRLVEMHDGTVVAESGGPGQGSTFTVTLPVCAPPARDAPARTTANANPPKSLRILVVDDNQDVLESFSTLLSALGHETRTAKDGQEALRIADEFHPDVAFLDIGMPRMDGYATAREFRTRPWASGVALYAISGWDQFGDRQRSYPGGNLG